MILMIYQKRRILVGMLNEREVNRIFKLLIKGEDLIMDYKQIMFLPEKINMNLLI
jgi:hypothetical protein